MAALDDGDAVRTFLDSCSTLTLAVQDERGPWAAAVYFVRVDRDLFFFSSPKSRHSAAVAEDARVAGVVSGAAEGHEDILGVQLSGRVEAVRDPAVSRRILAAYLAKFPFAAALLEADDGSLLKKVRFYRVDPDVVLWIDGSRGFGARTEVPW